MLPAYPGVTLEDIDIFDVPRADWDKYQIGSTIPILRIYQRQANGDWTLVHQRVGVLSSAAQQAAGTMAPDRAEIRGVLDAKCKPGV